MGKSLKFQKPLLHPKARVLVTGGAGFIGSALVHALNQHGVDRIILTDVFGHDTKWKNLAPLAFEDCLSADAFIALIQTNPDYFGQFAAVFHLGACSATTETDTGYLLENNYRYTKLLAEWALETHARFVYASSAATYGDGSCGMDDKDSNLQRLRPLNAYGYSKQIFDLHAQRRGWLNKIVGVKYFNVYGPNEYHKGEMRSLVCKAYEQIVSTGRLKLFKSHRPDFRDGEQMRDFIYVKDAVAMTMFLAENPQANGLFNLGGGKARTWVDLAKAIFSALDLPPAIDFIDMPESIRAQYQYYTCADITKLRAAGYTNSVTELEDAVRDYVCNYLKPGLHLGDSQPTA